MAYGLETVLLLGPDEAHPAGWLLDSEGSSGCLVIRL